MDLKKSNPCVICGRERVVSKTWTETIMMSYGESVITYTESVCPDSKCQKIFEERLKLQKEKTKAFQLAKEERIQRAKNARRKVST